MPSPKPGVDLEKELTCSICTEVLYQPLTLLDCLHTFCGSCLKDWFGWQATTADNSPNPPTPGKGIATCPSCRATVRDTRHNATVATLLDMFLSANPDKARSDAEKEEMHQIYKPGDNVLPKTRIKERWPEEQRIEELERDMLDRARELSLRDAGIETSGPNHARHLRDDRMRRRDDSGSRDTGAGRDTRHRDARDRSRRPAREEGGRRVESSARLQAGGPSPRHGRSESQQRSRDSSRSRRRAIEHQASIRSLISSSDVDSRDMEREIEEFAAQIQEEGLLDGLDLDNIDLASNDELTRKITEAYRRRQQQRSRHEQPRRSPSRPPTTDHSRSTSRQRTNSAHAPSASSTSHVEDRTRPPITSTHLEVRAGSERRRRRTSSGGRSATDAVRPSTADARPASRSQADLRLGSQTSDTTSRRPSFAESRSSSMPTTWSGAQAPVGRPFSERASASQNVTAGPAEMTSSETSGNPRIRQRPASLVVSSTNPLPSLGLPPSPGRQQRARSQFYHEPSIMCARCDQPHIEYHLHYSCSQCNRGNWNICLDCYRRGKGCLHWYGFGHAAFNKWERAQANGGDEHLEPPHILTANRYIPPQAIPGGADGRRTMTTEDPMRRLQSGMFCARCFAWANECFWRCHVCNEGDWGFCNNCVNQGRGCTHNLLPLTHVLPTPNPNSPLTFKTTCDHCRTAIPPTQSRYHCYSCSSTVVPETQPGDYDICIECYTKLVSDHHISAENGPGGWRRCLNGHRMVIIGFQDGNGGQHRYIVQDLVGGWDLHVEPYGSPDASNPGHQKLQKWWWFSPSHEKLARLVTRDVKATAPSGPPWTDSFPPNGGVGMEVAALWAWYPQVGSDDELPFPKGAEIREVEDVNGDWFFGYYMGTKGLFPAPYVRVRHA